MHTYVHNMYDHVVLKIKTSSEATSPQWIKNPNFLRISNNLSNKSMYVVSVFNILQIKLENCKMHLFFFYFFFKN